MFTFILAASYSACSVNDADFETCLAKAIEDAVNKLKAGEKSLGLPSIDPLHVDEVSLDLGKGPITLVLDIKDLDVVGLSSTTFKSTKLDREKRQLIMDCHTQHLRMDFQYKAGGKILVIAVQGDGPAFFEYDDVNSTHTISFKPVEKKGKTYWAVDDYKLDITPGSMKSHFQDLLKGNKAVSDQVNTFLNTEWKQFYQQIKGPGQDAVSDILKQFASRVFDRVPVGDIFKDV
ncbi:hypothetical protein ONE63_005014 [Megalurothrips usitatus]|uniref:Protein takeout-like n=1 Tax=Megalurothrips usitatus TaxID=439358 RepID=A0AAV7X5T2_9NEOP|nr:hypothetical protein ONE63_005014 [Megalurothrips usitatus]